MSNLVIGGSKNLTELTTSYDALSSKHGVTVVKVKVTAVDPQKKSVALQNGASIGYDKLVLSPGVDMMFDSIQGLQAANTSGQISQAWKAGPETHAIRKQLEAMPDGGVYALTVPRHRARLSGFDGIARLVAAGIGAAVMPESAALRLKDDVTQVIGLSEGWAARKLLVCMTPQGAELAGFKALAGCLVVIYCTWLLTPPIHQISG